MARIAETSESNRIETPIQNIIFIIDTTQHPKTGVAVPLR